MMNMIQACAPIAQRRPADSLLVATMGAMFALDRIEAELGLPKPANRINAVPLMGGSAGIGLGLALILVSVVLLWRVRGERAAG